MTGFASRILFGLVATVSLQAQLRTIENTAFKVGEKLTFSIGWEFISAGTAVLEVESMVTYKERPCYKVVATTKSNSFFSRLYKVHDVLESYIDAKGIYPLLYRKNTSEGGFERSFSVDFNHLEGKAVIDDRDSGRKEIVVPPYVQDILSAFYFVRTLPLDEGKDVVVPAFDNGKFTTVTVRVVKRETIDVTAGKFDCIVVRTPIGPFENRSDLFIWLTADSRRIPVLMKSKIIIGSVRAELERISGT